MREGMPGASRGNEKTPPPIVPDQKLDTVKGKQIFSRGRVTPDAEVGPYKGSDEPTLETVTGERRFSYGRAHPDDQVGPYRGVEPSGLELDTTPKKFEVGVNTDLSSTHLRRPGETRLPEDGDQLDIAKRSGRAGK